MDIEFRSKAIKDLDSLSKNDRDRILKAFQSFQEQDGKFGDVKKLVNHSPEYRLRVGSYRILFEYVGIDKILIYRILPRKDAYR